MKLNKEQLSSPKVLEPLAFAQQSGSDEAAHVCCHIAGAAASFTLAWSFDLSCVWCQTRLMSTRCFYHYYKKKEINIIMINNLHFNQVLRQRFILHLCFGLFRKLASAAVMVSQKVLADCKHRLALVLVVCRRACCCPLLGYLHMVTSTGVF